MAQGQPETVDKWALAPAIERGISLRRPALGEWSLFLLLAGPNLVLFAVFTYWPLFYNAYLSLMSWDMISPVKAFVGLENYRYLVSDREFRRVVLNTVIFTLGTVGGTTGLGLLLALLLNRPLYGRTWARGVIFAPVLLSGAAISVFWVNILNPRFGLFAQVLSWFSLSSPNWLNHPTWAMVAVILVYTWKNVGFSMVIYLAGLQAIPADLYEAARVDGAGHLGTFRWVTLPQLGPVTLFLLVVSMISSFQAFDIIKVMTDGGPVHATTTLLFYIYEQGFVAFNAGRAAAASVFLFLAMLAVTVIQLRLGERRVHYG
uniref:Sugar ABC transporter permease n=1 Tax=Thermorudis sp. TaxID=1969470 RepID=A0A7C2W6B0_9BACT